MDGHRNRQHDTTKAPAEGTAGSARAMTASEPTQKAHKTHGRQQTRAAKTTQYPPANMPRQRLDHTQLSPQTGAFYRRALTTLHDAGVPFLVGGAYAFAHYTGIERHTKDLDIFTRPQDARRALDALSADGCHTEVTFSHWLGKAYSPDGSGFADIIYSSGNGVARVDDEWFTHAVAADVLGMRVLLTPLEEMLWSKSFIMERERYDGADIAHLLHVYAARLDWPRLLRRFGANWRVLLNHLILLGFIYPEDRRAVPQAVMDELLGRLNAELTSSAPQQHLCNGTVLSRQQYLVDTERRGYEDGRLTPHGAMSSDEIAAWTDAIENIP